MFSWKSFNSLAVIVNTLKKRNIMQPKSGVIEDVSPVFIVY